MSQPCLDNLRPGDILEFEWMTGCDGSMIIRMKFTHKNGTLWFGTQPHNGKYQGFHPESDRLISIQKTP